MRKPKPLRDMTFKVQRHTINRIADLTEDFCTRVEDLCKLNDIDIPDIYLFLIDAVPKYLKAKYTATIIADTPMTSEEIIVAMLQAADMDPEDFLRFLLQEEQKEGEQDDK